MVYRLLTVVFLVLFFGAMPNGKSVAQHVQVPADLTGTLDGAAYKIRVPANWNGTLLVFAHATQPLGPITAESAPVAWPPVTPSLEDQLLGLGYALAGSGFQNSEIDGVQRTLALTNFFKGAVGNPSRTVIWGNSLGGTIALKLIEKYPGVYDGAVANAAGGAGTPENLDAALAFSLAYAAAFGWRDDVLGPIEDLRDDLDFFADAMPVLPTWPYKPAHYGRWEFVRLVMGQPPQAFWNADPQTGWPFWALQTWKAMGRRAAAEADYGGPVAENVGAQYVLTAADKAYLASLGVNADDLLAYMNARTNVTADRAARLHAEQWGGLSGQLRRPVLTMHAIYDGLVFVSNESRYAETVQAAGAGDRLVQAYVNTIGHCSFSANQYLSAIAAMNSWLDTGARPGALLLPASQGFDLGYVPPPWVF